MSSYPFKNETLPNPGSSFRDRLRQGGNPLLAKNIGRGTVALGRGPHVSAPLPARNPVEIPPFTESVRDAIVRDVVEELHGYYVPEESLFDPALVREAAHRTVDRVLEFQQTGEMNTMNTRGEA